MAAHPPVFDRLSIAPVTAENFDALIYRPAEIPDGKLKCVFFWGIDCPNCEIAKHVLSERSEEALALGLEWFHANVYDIPELGTRFSLFGIPAFFFFRDGKKLGRISPFPGFADFADAVRTLRAKIESSGVRSDGDEE